MGAPERHHWEVKADEFTAPFFYCSDDLLSFDSMERMLRYVEPVDVRADDLAFDSRGRRIVLRGIGVERSRFSVGGGYTMIDLDASGELAPGDLVRVLSDYVRSVGPERFGLAGIELTSMPLDNLVSAVASITDTT